MNNLRTITEINEACKDARSPFHALQTIHTYFANVGWSLEKDEWENKLTPAQRVAFATAVFNNKSV